MLTYELSTMTAERSGKQNKIQFQEGLQGKNSPF